MDSVREKLLAAFHSEIPDAETHALLAGTTLTPSIRGNTRSALARDGLIESTSSRRITPAGLEAAKHVPAIPQPGPNLIAFWREMIDGACR